MSLGTGAMKGWCETRKIPGPAGRFHGNPVSRNQPSKKPPTGTVTTRELQWRNLPYHEQLPRRGGKGWALNWQNRGAKQWYTKLNWASKLQIWWPKQWSVQGSDSQRSAGQTIANIATGTHMQAHGKARQGKPLRSPNRKTAGRNGLRLTLPKLH